MPDDKSPSLTGRSDDTPAANTDAIASGPPVGAPILAPAGAISAEPMNPPPISPGPVPKPTLPAPPIPAKKAEPKDTFRELIETVVFVVVLVLMLKTFLAEAFVIPTGSMAETLLGYHHKVTCQKCGYRNLVNASSEADPGDQRVQPVLKWRCEPCGWENLR